MGTYNVGPKVINTVNNLATNNNNKEDFCHPVKSSKPPDQMSNMMEMISVLAKEVSQLKMKPQ